ncbi:deoxyuridine 5'-triphosphate nucleotidohydrolase [Hasllibacter halocynthiae]|uniref:Deoxyuridine 5'-triphosphate nucleotidohydrolase n=1 Tax=Hasllibacter halocynthiae TaxID=595589 RepID=A0A2T0X281_9RHOB|nr:dUTP diphosphatase [Hasllibacter halocynthiae]PRY92964.1 deoxyuridine 5'-triphosphate nucleotidohydrolase [Hasllibacter halocynthiae]
MPPTIRFQRLPGFDRDVPLPAYASEGAAAADLRANLLAPDRRHGLNLDPGARAQVPLGFAMAIPDRWEAQIRARSGLALREGLAIVNAPGTIDADYRGPVSVILVNLGQEAVRLRHGTRVAQMVVARVPRPIFREVEVLGGTARGPGGFGSTGTD